MPLFRSLCLVIAATLATNLCASAPEDGQPLLSLDGDLDLKAVRFVWAAGNPQRKIPFAIASALMSRDDGRRVTQRRYGGIRCPALSVSKNASGC